MKYKIIHKSSYIFDAEVFLEPHTFRFQPRTSPFQTLETFELKLLPKAVGLSAQIDSENNLVHFGWFEGKFKKLEINAISVVEVLDHNPFDFLVFPVKANKMPIKYEGNLPETLVAALKPDLISNSLLNYGKGIQNETKGLTLKFLSLLTQRIHEDFNLINRPEGVPLGPNKTFRLREGSCRDLSWMQLQLLRTFGFATRFVSGYYYVPLENANYELHAWIEVFIPGAGWIGFDPSHGLKVHNDHIAIVTSAHYKDTMPVTGTIRGNASSSLSTQLDIVKLD